MKIKFNPDLGFQREAIDSIVDVFRGQETYQTNFTVAPLQKTSQMQLDFSELGIGNRLKLLEEDILENVCNIQLRNGLCPSDKLNSMDFTVEKAVYLSDAFKQLWERIKHRTTFRVDFDSEELIEECVSEIRDRLVIGKARFIYTKVTTSISKAGIETKEIKKGTYVYNAKNYQLPDIITYLQNETNLTRRTLVKIIKDSKRLEDFKNNPQKYIEQVAAIIKHQMRLFIVDGIKYRKISNDYYYAQELFEENELYGYLSKNMLESKKSVYDHVVYDSDVEKKFAESFELSEDVKVYTKLPAWFKVDTPLGSYNPDWAVLVEVDGQEKLYFVVETKATLFPEDLRPPEQAKIDCGNKHFKALDTEVDFTTANNYASFAERFLK